MSRADQIFLTRTLKTLAEKTRFGGQNILNELTTEKSTLALIYVKFTPYVSSSPFWVICGSRSP